MPQHADVSGRQLAALAAGGGRATRQGLETGMQLAAWTGCGQDEALRVAGLVFACVSQSGSWRTRPDPSRIAEQKASLVKSSPCVVHAC